MSNRVSDNKTTVCPNNHENIEGSKYCHICGLPVIDYTKELDDLINVLSEEEYRVKFSRENVFIGVGDQGCKLVYNLICTNQNS
jgi:hypothetical protein